MFGDGFEFTRSRIETADGSGVETDLEDVVVDFDEANRIAGDGAGYIDQTTLPLDLAIGPHPANLCPDRIVRFGDPLQSNVITEGSNTSL